MVHIDFFLTNYSFGGGGGRGVVVGVGRNERAVTLLALLRHVTTGTGAKSAGANKLVLEERGAWPPLSRPATNKTTHLFYSLKY